MILKDKIVFWKILEKYDDLENSTNFCNSISKIIQGIDTQDDIIEIIKFSTSVESEDIVFIDKKLNLTEVLF